MVLSGLGSKGRFGKRKGMHARLLALFMAAVLISFCNLSFAAESVSKYQVVNGSDDKAYLVNTSTGFVWVLTYRTLATGREPIAIPYKFIKISPSEKKDFIVEDAKDITCMPGR